LLSPLSGIPASLALSPLIWPQTLRGQGFDEEILDHLDQCVGARLLDLAGRGGGQSMPIMLDHDERGGNVCSLEQTCQLLRVMWRDKPIVGTLYDQKGRCVGCDVADRADIVLPGIGGSLPCAQGRAPRPIYTQALAQRADKTRRAPPVREIGRSPHIDHSLHAARLIQVLTLIEARIGSAEAQHHGLRMTIQRR
jgi:hypothetical protein